VALASGGERGRRVAERGRRVAECCEKGDSERLRAEVGRRRTAQ
jgi:hypothetical protein